MKKYSSSNIYSRFVYLAFASRGSLFRLHPGYMMLISFHKHQPLELSIWQLCSLRCQDILANGEQPLNCCTRRDGRVVQRQQSYALAVAQMKCYPHSFRR